MSHQPREQRVEEIRRCFHRALDGTGCSAVTRRWAESRFDHGLKLADEIENRFGPIAGRRVLEVASAQGGNLLGLYARGAHCTGSDKFDFAYGRLQAHFSQDQRIRLLRCDATTRWPFADSSFDIVLALELVEFVPDLDAFFGEMARVLRPGGFALISTGVTPLRGLRRDPIYGLPLISALPNRARRFVAEKIFRRGSGFRISDHSIRSAAAFRPYLRRRGFDILPLKFADSPIMARVARWPLASAWRWLLQWLTFDFVLIVASRAARARSGHRVALAPRLPDWLTPRDPLTYSSHRRSGPGA